MKKCIGYQGMFLAPLMLAALAGQAHAGPVGICLVSSAFGAGGTSSVEYASGIITAGCNPGYNPTMAPGGTVNPATMPPGLTEGTLTVTQPLPFGGTGVAVSTASLNEGILRAFADSQGTVGGCGGTCTTTGGWAEGQALFGDNVHFTITDGAPSAIVTVHAHLDGTVGSEAGSNSNNFNISDQFILGGSGCWGSATGLGFQPCLSQNYGFLTSSFSNQSATGFDFSGTFQVANGDVDAFIASLSVTCEGGAACDFSNTSQFSLSVPSNVTFTSDSGVLFSDAGTSATPEPASWGVLAAGLCGLGMIRRRAQQRG